MEKFEARHAQVDPDPVVELERRTQPWASCPNSRGFALEPHAQIVPLATIQSALAELKEWRKIGEAVKTAKTRGSA